MSAPPGYDFEAAKQAHTPYDVPTGHIRDSNNIVVYNSPYSLPSNMSILDRAGYEKELEIAKSNQKKKGEQFKFGNFFISYPYQVHVVNGEFVTAEAGEKIGTIGSVPGAKINAETTALPQKIAYVYFTDKAFDAKHNTFYDYAVGMEVTDLYLGYAPAPAVDPNAENKEVLYKDENGRSYKDNLGNDIYVLPGYKPAIDQNGKVVCDSSGKAIIIKTDQTILPDTFGNASFDDKGKMIVIQMTAVKVLLDPKTITREQQLEQKSIYYDLYYPYINRGKEVGTYYAKNSKGKTYETSGDGYTKPRSVVTREEIVLGLYEPSFWKRLEKDTERMIKDLENFTVDLFYDVTTLGEEVFEKVADEVEDELEHVIGTLFDNPLLLLALLGVGGAALYIVLK